MTEGPKILYCHCAYAQVIPTEVKQAVLEGLLDSKVVFESVPDLCEMSARKDPILKSLSADSNLRIAACYKRAVYGLFHSAGCSLPKEGPQIINMRVLSAQEALNSLLAKNSPSHESSIEAPDALSNATNKLSSDSVPQTEEVS